MSVCLNPCSIIVWPWPGLFPPVSSVKVLIRQCSITETLESQVAGMCTIDLFHCDFQQWLCAPQHRSTTGRARTTHWNTIEALSQSVLSAVTICCSAAGLVLTVFCSCIDSVFSERTPYILNTVAERFGLSALKHLPRYFCFILTLLPFFFSELKLDGRLRHSPERKRAVGSETLQFSRNSSSCVRHHSEAS